MPAPQAILELVAKFTEHRDAYLAQGYNEAQLRQEFLDPMFEALGWDLTNRQGYAEAYKEVIHEDAIKIGSLTKAPDYSFRVGGVRKFFLEAKKPSRNLKDDPEPAYQLRRYAWSAKLPLSVLTDFEEFAVYDCRIRPAPGDKASVGRTLYLKYTEYAERWEEITGIFSRDAVLKGSFDKYAESGKKKRGTAEVDAAFLKDIEQWREMLAKNFASRNERLEQQELNFAVQRTIDRIIFLRIAEDRGLETYGQLLALVNAPHTYARLRDLFRAADARYNSGLFHFHAEKGRHEAPDELTLGLKLDDKPLKEIIAGLYYPESPYEFSVLSADILGQVYEQFLGKVIRLTAGHQAKVEEKPEVKKAGGVYYTPTYIVDYIVRQTVGKLLEGKTPKEADKLTVLDPACGSGSFLIGAYQHILDWYRDQYAKAPEKHRKQLFQGPGGAWRLTSTERKRILLNNIYGVDIDPQAVEVTKLSLLLKVLEGENAQTLQHELSVFRQRALPDLGENIKCGNSLIGPEIFELHLFSGVDATEITDVRPFDWKTEFPEVFGAKAHGFSAVIGNPPYDVLEKDRGAASWPHSVLSEYVRFTTAFAPALGGKLNLFRFFVVRSLSLAGTEGRVGMITPLALLADISCAATRKHLMTNTRELSADCFPQKDNALRRVFANAKLSTMVLSARVARREAAARTIRIRVYPWNSFTDEPKSCLIHFEELELLDPKTLPIPLVDEQEWALCKKIHQVGGVVRLGEAREYAITRGEINQTIYREFITNNPKHRRLVKGVEIGQYHIKKRLSQGHLEWFDQRAFLSRHGPREVIDRRRIATQRITGVDERLRVVAEIVDPPAYFADSTNSITSRDETPGSLEYLLGILNSTLIQWRFRLTSTNNNVGTNEMESLPFRELVPTKKSDREAWGRIVHLVSQAREMCRAGSVDQARDVQRLIDQRVYELYHLTPAEIRLIEDATT